MAPRAVAERDQRRAARLTLAALLLGGACTLPRRTVTAPSPKDELTREQIAAVHAALLGEVERGGPNHLHSRRLFYYAPPFATAAGANVDAVQVAALLHDATKEQGVTDTKERFCTHGERGGALAFAVLTRLDTSPDFARTVAAAIREHMGPLGWSERRNRPRFVSRFCPTHRYPTPGSIEAQVLYDIDMLDLMTVDGVLKVVTNRQTNAEFGPETLEESALTGPDSAWGSVEEAGETLRTPSARTCGATLARHTRAFLDGVDWAAVEDLEAFATAVTDYKRRSPLPPCLPAVPGTP